MTGDPLENTSLVGRLSGDLQERYDGLSLKEQKQFRRQLPGRARHALSLDDAAETTFFDIRVGRRSAKAKERGAPPLTKSEANERR